MSAPTGPLTPAQRWQLVVDALRSGEYPQARQSLTRLDAAGKPDGFCCLGVACEVAMANGVELVVGVRAAANEHPRRTYRTPGANEGTQTAYLPQAVADWLDTTRNPEVLSGLPDRPRRTLSDLNDNFRFDFARIADAIERTFIRPAPATPIEALTVALGDLMDDQPDLPASVLLTLAQQGWYLTTDPAHAAKRQEGRHE